MYADTLLNAEHNLMRRSDVVKTVVTTLRRKALDQRAPQASSASLLKVSRRKKEKEVYE
jgi:hypothetical protein